MDRMMDAAAILEELSKPDQDKHFGEKILEDCSQSITDPPAFCIGAAGILRYNRESDNNKINLKICSPTPQSLEALQMKCEYCGQDLQPSLDLPPLPEMPVVFCCLRWQQLYEMLEEQKNFVRGSYDDQNVDSPKPARKNKSGTKTRTKKELLLQSRELDDPNNFILELPTGLGEQPQPEVCEEPVVEQPVAEPVSQKSKVLSFRLSRAPGKGWWTAYPASAALQRSKRKKKEPHVSVKFCTCKTLQFGMCHHQVGSEFIQKHYSSGVRFITVFPDGSAELFYPSGLLALVVIVTEKNGRVCVVYDECGAPNQQIRAIFQSDGQAACYHSNRKIWLSLNRSGGRCLDEEGTKIRQWNWNNQILTSSTLQPVFLSLNKSVGVRVLGKEQVFVSFLAGGRQARFSVGSCCVKDECSVRLGLGPSALKEELFVLAAQIRIHLVIQLLHQCLKAPSVSCQPRTTPSSHLLIVSQKLLTSSGGVIMSDSDRAFIHWCLRHSL